MNRACLIVLLLISTAPSRAEDRPTWTDQGSSSDGSHKYYVGRAVSAPSDSEGVFQATVNARKQAISENFGTWVKIESESFRSSDLSGSHTSLGQSSEEVSDEVRLIEFEQVGLHFERKNGRVDAWVRFRYPRDEIDTEKARLRTLRTQSSPQAGGTKLSRFGSPDATGSGGVIEIHSIPEGLPVQIDLFDEILGRKLVTPLLYQGLPVGKHLVKINDPRFELYEEAFSATPGARHVIRAVMKPAKGRLKIHTSPDGATLTLGARTYLTPIEEIEVPAGVKLSLEVSHPEAGAPVREEVLLRRNDELTRTFLLDLKPVLVSINSSPEGAEILAEDWAKLGETPATLKLPAHVAHRLTLVKEGYENKTVEIEPLPGGSTKLLGAPVVLAKGESKPSPTPEPVEDTPATSHPVSDQIRHFLLGIRMGVDGQSLRQYDDRSLFIGFSGEWEWNRWMGPDFALDFGAGLKKQEDESSQDRRMKTRASVGFLLHTPYIKRVRVYAGGQAFWHEMEDPLLSIQYRLSGNAWKAGIDWAMEPPDQTKIGVVRFEVTAYRPDRLGGSSLTKMHFWDFSLAYLWGF